MSITLSDKSSFIDGNITIRVRLLLKDSTSGIFVIEINLSTFASWVLDIGCGSHICTNVQGLKISRDLAKGEVDLRVGNGAKVAALAVGTYVLTLPSGLTFPSHNRLPNPRFGCETLSFPGLLRAFPFPLWDK